MTASSSIPLANARPLLVILDTNIWIQHMLLASPTGAGLLHAVRRLNGHIGLPETVQRELREVLARRVDDAAEKASKQLDFIARVLPEMPSFKPPTREKVFTAVDRCLQNLHDLLQVLPITLDLVKLALDRVVHALPPNGPNREQFRDSLILETAMAAARNHEVHFVTADTGFFQEHKPEKGPAVEILSQISRAKLSVSIYADLAECTSRLAPTAPEVDRERALLRIAEAISTEVQSSSEQRLFSASLERAEKLILSPTERPGVLSVSFDLLYELASLPESESLSRQEARLHALGDCYYDLNRNVISDASLDRLVFSWRESDGTPRRQFVKYLRASIVAAGSVG